VITTIVLCRVEPSLIPRAAHALAGIDRVVTEAFPKVPGLQRTQTLTAFRAYSKKDTQQAWDIGNE
jgi:hypothetical protein